MDIQNLVPVDYSNQRVLTTAQVAEALDCSIEQLRSNFKNHKDQFEEGVHYFKVEGGALYALKRAVKKLCSSSTPSEKGVNQIHAVSFGKGAKCLNLWTKQGVARLSKLIDTPQAWEMMDKLKIDYFAVEGADKPANDNLPQVVEIEGVRGYLDKDNIVLLNAADVARELGFVEGNGKFSTSGENYIRWERVNSYLAEFEFPPVDKDSFIPESEFYLLAMKAKNEKAKQFQWKVASKILPSIRKYGFYSEKPPAETPLADEEPVKKVRRQPVPELAVVYAVLLSNMLVKIGMTRDLTARMKDLQKETKADILAWVSTPFMTRDETALLERSLKVKFFDKNKGGEFYDVDFDTVKAALISPDDKFNKLLTLAREMEPSPEKNQLLLQAANLLK